MDYNSVSEKPTRWLWL